MQSFVIASKNTEIRENQFEILCKEFNINPLDQIVIEEEAALGIELIRNISKTIFQYPLKGEKKALLVKNAQNLTLTSQNAMLKLLEEPPLHTIIVLSVTQKDLLLPTILSRCSVIEKNERSSDTPTENVEILSMGQRLTLAQEKAKTKDEALAFLEGQILEERTRLLGNMDTKSVRSIKLLQNAYTIIYTSNVQPRLVLENALLNF